MRQALKSAGTLYRKQLLNLGLGVALALGSGLGCRPQQAAEPVFDVPALVGKKVREVAGIVGTPTSTGSATAGSETGTAVFRKDQYVLSVDYLNRNGRVTAFTLAYADPTQSVKEADKEQLLQVGKLDEKNQRYTLDYIEDSQKVFSFTGVKVVPAPVTYNVTLRVTGPPAATTVIYKAPSNSSPSAGGASTTDAKPGENFMTIPPWDIQFTATTGTIVGLEAGLTEPPTSSANGTAEKVTVQILLDGKVAKEFSSALGVAHCELELD
jgi:hypothetical protein